MPGTATTTYIDGTPTDGYDAWIDSLVAGGAWTDSDGGTITISWTAFQGTMDGENSYGWTSAALAGLREALSLWENVANIDFVEVASAADADAKFWWGTQNQAGGSNVLGWSELPGFSDSETLDVLFNAQDSALSDLGKGGQGLITMVHEIGHLLGLAHPHDGGPGWDSTEFPGVSAPFDDYGDYGLNQGIYTTMSYNAGWPDLLPGHTSESWGLQYGPMVLDVAAIQAIYGANTTYASGNNVYKLPTSNGLGTYWSTIWDTGGIDTISNEGASTNATIDLRAAFGGYWSIPVSYATTSSGTIIEGGYTIARGVEIENAIGGSGDDKLTGNSGDNILDGGGGADRLYGGLGNDRLIVDSAFESADGGEGIDTLALRGANFSLNLSNPTVAAKLEGIERIDLTGAGDNTLLVSQDNVLNGVGEMVGDKYVLVVEGNSGDKVLFAESNWTMTGSFTNADGTFDRWELGNAEIHVEHGVIAQNTPLSASILLSSLDGTNGFTLSGGPGSRYLGRSVASAGDVNGDGIDDLIVGDGRADSGAYNTGASYVVFGRASGFAANVDLSTLNGINGFKLSGAAANDWAGYSVASAGDVNGDGFADLIIGATQASAPGGNAGASYVVFGKASDFDRNVNLGTLNGSNGFRLNGVAAADFSGYSVASAGDFNNDGFDDLIVGAWGATPPGANSWDFATGAAYVVYGKASGFAASINLSALNASTGLRLTGVGEGDQAGISVASAGDFNGDGYDDVIVGARNAYTNGEGAGASYVVFGRASGAPASIDLTFLNGSNGFELRGARASDNSGVSVASAGDVNGDGFADLIVGAPRSYPNGRYAGSSYVVFGKAYNFEITVELSDLDGTNGFRLIGAEAGDLSGFSVASAGDVNGDGFADLIVGSHQADPTATGAGASYVVFGKASGFAASIDLATLDGANGFRIAGIDIYDLSGISVASAGDVNGDGYDDLIVGALNAGIGGQSYVVFGGAFGSAATPVTTTGTAAAEILIGGRGNDVLTGGGGRDVFHAGADNDRLIVKDLTFRLADGGAGTDTLALDGAGLSLDLSNLLVAGKLEGIERIDLTGTGNNTLIVNQLSILGGIGAVVGGKHILVVERNYGDTVQFAETTWTKAGVVATLDGTFDRWVLGNAEVHVGKVNGPAGSGATIVGTFGNDIISTTVTVFGQPLATDLGDTIDGGAGADTMTGGWGDDIYIVDYPGDQVIELVGGGTDLVRSTANTYTLRENVENLELLTGASQGYGNGLDNRITGNDANNYLDGGLGADTMVGGKGADTYVVDDTGDIVIEAANGSYSDTVNSTVSYRLSANVENLELMGSDAINGTGNDDQNRLTGNSSNNILDGGANADFMMGEAGDDTYIVDNSHDIIIENQRQGIDTVMASATFMLSANVENLTLTGTADAGGYGNELNNVLTGNAGSNYLDGDDGNDVLYGGAGDDELVGGTALAGGTNQLWGGAGNDTASYVGTSGVVYADLAAQVGYVDGILVDQMNSIENLIGGYGADVLVGDAGGNVLSGGQSGDLLYGQGGDDILIGGLAYLGVNQLWGGTGNDTASYVDTNGEVYADLRAQAGYVDGVLIDLMNSIENVFGGWRNDVLVGNAVNNVLTGNDGADCLYGLEGDDTFMGGDSLWQRPNQFWGGAGSDTASYVWTSGVVYADLAAQSGYINGFLYDVMNSIENITGGSGNDVLVGDANSNVLMGGAGGDVLYGQDGDDILIGGAAAAGSTNQLWGGMGTDAASYVGTTGAVYADLGSLSAYVDGVLVDQMSSIENLIGSSGSDVLVGDANGNVLTGGAGTDYLYGQDGNDTLIGGSAASGNANQLWGGTGNDTASYVGTTGAVYADLGAQSGHVDGVLVDLMNSIENLTGGSNGDTLVGNAGANRLAGGAGGDALWGKGGADLFVYNEYADSNLVTGYDIIGDFVSGTSKLDLTALGLDASHIVIQSNGQSTSLYIEKTAGVFDVSTDLAISLVGANAITLGDILL